MQDLVPQAGIKPMPFALEAGSLNHWTATEVPIYSLFFLRHSGNDGLLQTWEGY